MPDLPDFDGAPVAASGALRALDAVLFDFHGTLAMTVEPVAWITAAAADCGVQLDRGRATVLADRIATAGGLPGHSKPTRVPPQLIDAWTDRDLDERAHREAYVGLAGTVACDIPGMAQAVYDRILRAEGWLPYLDAASTLRALRGAGVRTAVVSNIGFDIRPLLDAWGLLPLFDAVLLSYEVNCIKPDPKIFWRACAQLGVEAERTLMIGDTPADAGAVGAGCCALILPAAPAGRANGLHQATRLALNPPL